MPQPDAAWQQAVQMAQQDLLRPTDRIHPQRNPNTWLYRYRTFSMDELLQKAKEYYLILNDTTHEDTGPEEQTWQSANLSQLPNAAATLANNEGPMQDAIHKTATTAMSILERSLYSSAQYPDSAEFTHAMNQVREDIYSKHQEELEEEMLKTLTRTLEEQMTRITNLLYPRVQRLLPQDQQD